MSAWQIADLIDLARSQLEHPGDWSLTTNASWLQQMYLGADVQSHFWRKRTGALRAVAAVREVPGAPAAITVTSMLRPRADALWVEQRAWIETTLRDMPRGIPIEAVCEALTDAEAARWQSAGYDLTFEELVMEHAWTTGSAAEAPRWPVGTALTEWSPAAAVASFEVYENAFRNRPGFPGLTQADWIEHQTDNDLFLTEASFLVRIDGVAVGFVISGHGWIGQVGVAPAFRRRGLAGAMVTEALARLHAVGHELVHLHVNTNNPGAMATWRGLGFEPVGRRGRFERGAIPR
ncbi:MAG TPA: GNAT family N-acetyltransferase [Candidatus Dormibacteraeota bacterium]